MVSLIAKKMMSHVLNYLNFNSKVIYKRGSIKYIFFYLNMIKGNMFQNNFRRACTFTPEWPSLGAHVLVP